MNQSTPILSVLKHFLFATQSLSALFLMSITAPMIWINQQISLITVFLATAAILYREFLPPTWGFQIAKKLSRSALPQLEHYTIALNNLGKRLDFFKTPFKQPIGLSSVILIIVSLPLIPEHWRWLAKLVASMWLMQSITIFTQLVVTDCGDLIDTAKRLKNFDQNEISQIENIVEILQRNSA